MVVKLYVDLVIKGLRAVEENAEGIPLVPLFIRDEVKREIDNMEK